jgi:hypothetical protein
MGLSMSVWVEKRVGDRWVFLPAPSVKDGDWFHGHYPRDAAGVIAGMSDNYKPAVEWRPLPDDLSPELRQVADWCIEENGMWLLLSELEAYDFDQPVLKMSRIYSPEELAERGWLGNGDGTPYDDVQRHRTGKELERQIADGYVERAYPVRTQVRPLFEVMENIRKATAGVPSDQIRLVVGFTY